MSDHPLRRPEPPVPRWRPWAKSIAVAASYAASPGAPRSALRILTYHRVNASHPGDRLTVHPRAFAEQMEHLAGSGRPVLRLESAVSALRTGEGLPPRAVALSFDDGYRDNLREAIPLLDRLSLPASFFVISGHVGTRLNIDRYQGCCEEDVSLDWAEVKEVAARGHEVGAHGRTHRELATLAGDDLRGEIAGSRAEIARGAGTTPALFCYPRGSESPAVRQAVAEAGFAAALTVYPGPNRPGGDPFGLTRTEISGRDDLATFAAKLEGRHDAWHRIVQRLGGLRHGRAARTA